ncbi:hypothetical protein QCB44_00750 [Thiomicrorhabdus sp. zzn3]|uniref:hypothetical protein n=1 Tax=Thiomicrorhabdus sp. zzn3 TaxID=3039775 RepID=UPI0024371D29|nr:hypothetical protein [Thiomicrorhabdus sp. zzn3]MDG6777225.1 hypothetical protein [Thiomicrorhabdus sp. zzn3]
MNTVVYAVAEGATPFSRQWVCWRQWKGGAVWIRGVSDSTGLFGFHIPLPEKVNQQAA